MRCCPLCKTTVVSSLRYNDNIKRHFQDIVQVKKKLLSTRIDPKVFAEKLHRKIFQTTAFLNSKLMPPKVKQHKIYPLMSIILNEIAPNVTPRHSGHGKKMTFPCLDNDQRYLFEVQVDVLVRVLDILKTAPRVASPAASVAQPVIRNIHPAGMRGGNTIHYYSPSQAYVDMKEPYLIGIFDRLHRMLQSLMDRQHFCSEEYQAFVAEVDRLDLIRAYFLLLSSPYYAVGVPAVDQEVNALQTKLIKNVKTLTDADKTEIKTILASLGDRLKTGLGISDVERQQIVRAMGLAQGHWYKCPNGHIYAIGECGGANQESRCPDCGARIGGQRHQLVEGNRVAGEMDGARHAAWSEQANMANYGRIF